MCTVLTMYSQVVCYFLKKTPASYQQLHCYSAALLVSKMH